ncbi:MurR/RpiR family transcriptional regulator [Castellaniella sp.]|uniref:MurR/RpiR family transcriptional regulator n=1 Tax=Castellaniella sp. TaxID=1955812 RepID=UPI003569F2B0
MNQPTLEALTRDIRAQYDRLSPQFRLAARYLLEHPTQVGTLSARKLAALIGVQPATLVRLARHLGFPGWDALKAVFVRDLQASEISASVSLMQTSRTDGWLAQVQQQSRHLAALAERNHRQAVMAGAERLARAPHIGVAGFHASHPAAFSLRYLCSLFRPDVHLLQNTGGIMQLMLRHLRPQDAVVLIEQDPYVPDTLALGLAALEQGCALVTLSDSPLAPCARIAGHPLLYPAGNPLGLPSSVALQALVELLVWQLRLLSDTEQPPG